MFYNIDRLIHKFHFIENFKKFSEVKKGVINMAAKKKAKKKVAKKPAKKAKKRK